MPSVLTEESNIRCAHNGKVQVAGQSRLTVNGRPVLRLDGIQGRSIPPAPADPNGCITVPDPNTGTVKCATVTSASGGATKLFVNGSPVALDTLTGQTSGTVSGAIQSLAPASAVQTRLTTI